MGKKAQFLVDFNHNKVSSGSILTPFLVQVNFNPNKVSPGSILIRVKIELDETRTRPY